MRAASRNGPDEERRELERRVASGDADARLELARLDEAEDGAAAAFGTRLREIHAKAAGNVFGLRVAEQGFREGSKIVREVLAPLILGDGSLISGWCGNGPTPLKFLGQSRFSDGRPTPVPFDGRPTSAWWQDYGSNLIVLAVLDGSDVTVGAAGYPMYAYDDTGAVAYSRPFIPQFYWHEFQGDPSRPAAPPGTFERAWASRSSSDRVRVPVDVASRWLTLHEAGDI